MRAINGKKTGRPRKELDKRLFENLCAVQCTEAEIAGIMEVSEDTITKWCLREYGKSFTEIFNDKKSRGKVSLRRMQWKLAEKSPAMAIFLGKNYLGQRDERNVEVKGEIGATTLAELMMEGYYEAGPDEDA